METIWIYENRWAAKSDFCTHAVYHGAEAVMVTGETAVGNYPVEAIKYLANTAKEAENV